ALHLRHRDPAPRQLLDGEGEAALPGATAQGDGALVLQQEEELVFQVVGDEPVGQAPLQRVGLVVGDAAELDHANRGREAHAARARRAMSRNSPALSATRPRSPQRPRRLSTGAVMKETSSVAKPATMLNPPRR